MNSKLELIKYELLKRRLIKNQADLAKQLEYNKSHFSQLVNGAQPVSASLKHKLNALFGINLNFWNDDTSPMFTAESLSSNDAVMETEPTYTTSNYKDKYIEVLEENRMLHQKLLSLLQEKNKK